MRLSGASLLCTVMLSAQPPVPQQTAGNLTQAQQDVERMRDLAAAGAVAPSRVEDAQMAMDDAFDDSILNRTLYGRLTAQELSEQQASDMVNAASRRLQRQMVKIERIRKLVDAGVLARAELVNLDLELESRRVTLDLANSRARLLFEIVEYARREAAAASSGGSEYHGGETAFRPRDLLLIQTAFETRFSRALPISANGDTAVHRAMGFDHRGRVDVALSPDQEEGVWLRAWLTRRNIPYFAFRAAVPGKATGAHIHIGAGSTRLRAAD